MAGLMSSMGALAFPDATVGDFAVNVLTVLILYGPAYLANTGAMLFGKWIPDKIGFDNHKIDGGRIHSDGNRLLGDGKSWEGLFGGGVFSGILVMIAHYIWDENTPPSDRPFIDPLLISDSSDWFWVGTVSYTHLTLPTILLV